MRKDQYVGPVATIALFVAAWAADQYVDEPPLSTLLIATGALAALLWFASTPAADRMVWKRMAHKIQPYLSSSPSSKTEDLRIARAAGNRVLSELRDCGIRLKEWIEVGPDWWKDRYTLPVVEWSRHLNAIAEDPILSKAWQWVSHAYTRIDAVNRAHAAMRQEEFHAVGSVLDDSNGHPSPSNLREVRESIARADRELTKALDQLE
jgi:hypothetical protein